MTEKKQPRPERKDQPLRASFASLVKTNDPVLGQIVNAQRLNEQQRNERKKK